MGQADLDKINQRIRDTNAEVNQLIEKRMMSGDPTDDKLSLFRQQAAIISRKKEAAAETLREAREDLVKCELEIDEKRSQVITTKMSLESHCLSNELCLFMNVFRFGFSILMYRS